MAKTERNKRIKQNRRSIMVTLRLQYPRFVEGESVYLDVLDSDSEYDRVLCVRDLNYLYEKGYVEYKGNAGIDVYSISVKNCVFKMTAKGTEVADQLADDPALDL